MTVPGSVQQRIRVLGRAWHVMEEHRERGGRGPRHGREVRREGGLLSRTGALRIAAVEARSVRATVDGWLQADRFMPRKQRHTAKRVYDRLVSEKGYEGSYSPVQRYVKRWREEHRLPSDGYLELKWHPGEAQVDFGMAQAVVGGTGSTCIAWSSRSRIRTCATAWPCPGRTPNACARGCARCSST